MIDCKDKNRDCCKCSKKFRKRVDKASKKELDNELKILTTAIYNNNHDFQGTYDIIYCLIEKARYILENLIDIDDIEEC